MSRVGRKPIQIPDSVQVQIQGRKVSIKGPKGEFVREIPLEIKVELRDGKIFVVPEGGAENFEKIFKGRGKKIKALWGLVRALLNNMVEGVVKEFEKKLEIEGIGFKALVEGEHLVLNLGFSHPLKLKIPQGIKIIVEKGLITVSGADKEAVGQFAAEIKRLKPVEPYKGKGIKYAGEIVKRKTGKKAVGSTL